MKINFTIIFSLVFLAALYGFSQDDKAPIAVNDYAEALALETIEIKVLENDYAYDNHPFQIFLAFGAQHGDIVNTDTSVIYTPEIAFRGLDSITYIIKDLENNLISETAKVYITISNPGFDFLNVNKVSCRINSFGLQYWDLGSGSSTYYEVPAGSGKSTIFSQSLWVGGLDENDQLCLAAEKYRQNGTDFFPGPFMDSLSFSEENDVAWNRVWKLSSDEILYHREHWQDEAYEPIENIALWPGNGDTGLGQAAQLAPYYDWDGNGIYNPLAGDFPLIKGDQAVFTIVNDARGIHSETTGTKMGIEVQTSYYAYDEPDDSALNYTSFADQYIINRSPDTYHEVYAANFLDFDLGSYNDDFLYSDTSLHSAIVFNGDDEDGTGGSGEYGLHPPAQAFTCLNYEMSAFVYFFSVGVIPQMTDPQIAPEYYTYMQTLWKDGTPLTYGGNGYGGDQTTKFIFSGNPVTGEGWTEQNVANLPGDRRGLVVSGPHDFYPGDTLHLEYALVYARDFEGDNLSSVALLKTRIQEVRNFYQDALGIEKPEPALKTAKLYPNPCTEDLHIDLSQFPAGTPVHFVVIDILGKQLMNGKLKSKTEHVIDFSKLDPGIYFIHLTDGKNTYTKKVIRKRM
jgi:hypothetical protein